MEQELRDETTQFFVVNIPIRSEIGWERKEYLEKGIKPGITLSLHFLSNAS